MNEPHIEQRHGNWIVVDAYGGTRIATMTEIQLWKCILELKEQLHKEKLHE